MNIRLWKLYIPLEDTVRCFLTVRRYFYSVSACVIWPFTQNHFIVHAFWTRQQPYFTVYRIVNVYFNILWYNTLFIVMNEIENEKFRGVVVSIGVFLSLLKVCTKNWSYFIGENEWWNPTTVWNVYHFRLNTLSVVGNGLSGLYWSNMTCFLK